MHLIICIIICINCIAGTCKLDKLEVQSELEVCMEKLQDFLSDWLTSVRKGGRTPFDTCR